MTCLGRLSISLGVDLRVKALYKKLLIVAKTTWVIKEMGVTILYLSLIMPLCTLTSSSNEIR